MIFAKKSREKRKKGATVRRKTELPELLAPAGSEEALYAAVSAGADAVYLGGLHSARAHAKNFDEAALSDAVTYAHLHGVRVYIALNTLLFDRELAEFLSYADRVAASGVDAAIVADLGVMATLRRHLPALPLHASTQAFVHNTAAADFFAARGVPRVVAARELSLASITSMVEHSAAEVEVFLHGALCVSHSGQCLFSSLVGGRSGNRGECAQPCRLPYGKGYPLSLADLSLARHIPPLIDTGVASLKIEGRMKAPAYVAGVTGIYRRLLDERRAATHEEERELAALFSRSGFTDKYFTARLSEPMGGIRTAENKAESREREENFTKIPVFVTGHAIFRRDTPARLTLTLGERSVTVSGDIPAAATGAPLSREEAVRRLSRLGGTGLAVREGDLTAEVGEGLFLAASQLNALRRAAVAALTDSSRPLCGAVYTPTRVGTVALVRRTADCRKREQAEAAKESGFFDRVILSLPEAVETGYFPEGVSLPPVITDGEWPEVKRMLAAARASGATHATVAHGGQLAAVLEAGLTPLGSFRLNVTNRETLAALRELGILDVTLSPELTAARCRDLGGRVIVYGRIPLMLTERCFVRETAGCARCGSAVLTDRRGVSFPLVREWPHRMLVLNSLPTYLGDRPALLAAAGDPPECYLFTNETKKETAAVIAAARAGKPLTGAVRRLPQ